MPEPYTIANTISGIIRNHGLPVNNTCISLYRIQDGLEKITEIKKTNQTLKFCRLHTV